MRPTGFTNPADVESERKRRGNGEPMALGLQNGRQVELLTDMLGAGSFGCKRGYWGGDVRPPLGHVEQAVR